LEKRRWLARRFKRRRAELIKNAAAHFAKLACALGVSEVYIGYPRDIAHRLACERNSAWPYWRLLNTLARALENAGIACYAVEESNTSKYCAYHGCEVERAPRGLVRCPHGHALHADINAALNVLKRASGKLPERLRVLSFTPTPGGVLPAKKRRRKTDSPAL